MARFNMFFSPAKAVEELGLPQTPVEQAFADALEWFASNGYLDSKKPHARSGGGQPWRSP
jgi:dihydroflavonol-4-reductase